MINIAAFSAIQVFARTLLGEARGEGKAGMSAVANVIMNRVAHPCWWGRDVKSVCLDPYQFSCWNTNNANRQKIIIWDETDPIYVLAEEVALLAMDGKLPDMTCGADNYYVKGTPAPAWASGHEPCAVIGHHLFFKI